eukprot:845887-Rhodomonas_salina.1
MAAVSYTPPLQCDSKTQGFLQAFAKAEKSPDFAHFACSEQRLAQATRPQHRTQPGDTLAKCEKRPQTRPMICGETA